MRRQQDRAALTDPASGHTETSELSMWLEWTEDADLRSVRQSASLVSGSRPVVGSSMTRKSGSPTSAIAIDSRRYRHNKALSGHCQQLNNNSSSCSHLHAAAEVLRQPIRREPQPNLLQRPADKLRLLLWSHPLQSREEQQVLRAGKLLPQD